MAKMAPHLVMIMEWKWGSGITMSDLTDFELSCSDGVEVIHAINHRIARLALDDVQVSAYKWIIADCDVEQHSFTY